MEKDKDKLIRCFDEMQKNGQIKYNEILFNRNIAFEVKDLKTNKKSLIFYDFLSEKWRQNDK